MTSVWLIRHGESESNVGLPTTKPTEFTQLTNRGHQQAQAIAAVVPPPDLIVTSPYLRAKQTAQPTIDCFPYCPQAEWQVQEFDYLTPVAKAAGWPEGGTSQMDVLQLSKAYWQRRDPYYSSGVGAESFAELMQRVAEMLQQLHQLEGKTVLVFSHSGFMRAVLWSSLLRQPEVNSRMMDKFYYFINSIRIPNGAIIKLHLHDQETFFSPILIHHLQGL
ncbi:MAG: histidine phosphatase family protein [Leptolyngbyaceae cyanobacterium bins.349]|nr:histidine phosphatase family protein [Leptolyngbyaceae cyanobacterium bins.349]